MKKNFLSVFAVIAVSTIVASCQNTLTPPATDPDTSGAALSDLRIVSGDESVALSAEFAGGTLAYTARLPNSCENLRIYATPEDVNASVSVSVGADSVPLTVTTLVNSTDPIFTGKADVAVGLNDISVVVTAADGVATRTYAIGATRVAEGSLSSEVRLESLLVTANGSPVTLAYETGKGGSGIYTGRVAASVTSVDIAAEARDSAALIYGTGVVALSPGMNYLRLIVTAADGTVQWNFIQIERGAVATITDYVGTWRYTDTGEEATYTMTIGADGSAEYTIAYSDNGGIYTGTLAVDAATGTATATSSTVRNYVSYIYDASAGTLDTQDEALFKRVGSDTGSIIGEWASGSNGYIFNADGTFTHTSSSGSSVGVWDGSRIIFSDDDTDFSYTAHVSLSAPTSMIVQNGHDTKALTKQ